MPEAIDIPLTERDIACDMHFCVQGMHVVYLWI